MSEHSAFQRLHVEKSADEPVVGLLEQLGLPTAAISYIRKNLRTIWIVTGCVAAIIVSVSLYGSYTTYRDNKAASALTEAMKAEGTQKQELLSKVVTQYGSTSSGLWARIELSHDAAENGEPGRAIEELVIVRNDVAADNPVMPLLLARLATLYEITEAPDKAIEIYGELAAYKGFEGFASKAMGRLYEQQNNTARALSMYQKYLAAGEGENVPPGADPEREMIEARVAALKD